MELQKNENQHDIENKEELVDYIDEEALTAASNRAFYRKMWQTSRYPYSKKWLEENDKEWIEKYSSPE